VCDFLLSIIIIYILSRTASKLLLITGPIFTVNRGCCLSLIHSFGVNTRIQDCKMQPQKLQTSLCCMVQSIFRYLDPFGVTHKCDKQGDGETDFIVANAMIHYSV